LSSLFEAALLGIVQGLSEFLPISSSAHLILARVAFGFDGDKFGLPFVVATHVGTLIAVLAYFQRDLVAMLQSLPRLFRPGPPRTGQAERIDEPDVRRGAEGARLMWLIAVGTIPAVVVGVLFSEAIEGLQTPAVTVGTMSVGALGLFAAERLGAKRRNEESLTMPEAFLIGCAQAAALVPGISRSGATITAAMLLGLRRAEAARFTFLLGILAILGAAVLELPDMLEAGMGGEAAPLFAVGVVTSGIVGYLSVRFLIGYLANHSLAVFAWYRLAVAAIVLWLLIAPVS
jgi:undecaprenyl-diphosphatase